MGTFLNEFKRQKNAAYLKSLVENAVENECVSATQFTMPRMPSHRSLFLFRHFILQDIHLKCCIALKKEAHYDLRLIM